MKESQGESSPKRRLEKLAAEFSEVQYLINYVMRYRSLLGTGRVRTAWELAVVSIEVQMHGDTQLAELVEAL